MKTRISAPAHPSETGIGRVSGLVLVRKICFNSLCCSKFDIFLALTRCTQRFATMFRMFNRSLFFFAVVLFFSFFPSRCSCSSRYLRRAFSSFHVLGLMSTEVQRRTTSHSPSNLTLMGKKHLTPLYPTPPTYTVHQIPQSLSSFTSSPPSSKFCFQYVIPHELHHLFLSLSPKKYLSEIK